MFTKEQLLQAIPDVPAKFSIEELEAILTCSQSPKPVISVSFPQRPANLTSEEAADWDYYTSSQAMALYAKSPIPPEVAALRGIAANLPIVDLRKSAKEWEAERVQEKYGV